MKKLSKVHIKGTIFISTNVLTLLSLCKITNATSYNFGKPSTVRLLCEVFRNPSGGFLQKLPNGKMKASFLYSGKTSSNLHNFNIKGSSAVYVKKDYDEKFNCVHLERHGRKIIEEGIAFKIITSSKSGLLKQIDIVKENENIVVTSQKGNDTSQQIFKRTILDFGDGPSTSAQASASSPTPKVITTKYSSFNTDSKSFNVETMSEYNPTNSKLISSITKNNSTGIKESIMIHEDDMKTKIIENPDGSGQSYITNKFNETILTKITDSSGNTTMIKKIGHPYKFLTQIYGSNQNLLEETTTDRDFYETKRYNENGDLILTTTMNKFPDGSMVGTSISQISSVTNEYRPNGSLASTITRTPNGELIKQDFDLNNLPINSPYKIN